MFLCAHHKPNDTSPIVHSLGSRWNLCAFKFRCLSLKKPNVCQSGICAPLEKALTRRASLQRRISLHLWQHEAEIYTSKQTLDGERGGLEAGMRRAFFTSPQRTVVTIRSCFSVSDQNWSTSTRPQVGAGFNSPSSKISRLGALQPVCPSGTRAASVNICQAAVTHLQHDPLRGVPLRFPAVSPHPSSGGLQRSCSGTLRRQQPIPQSSRPRSGSAPPSHPSY